MLDSVIELVKFVGGLGGLASSAFLVYDRVFRYQPLAFLFPAEYKTNIRLKNVAAETIIIDEIAIVPPFLRAARANDLVTTNQERAAAWYSSAESKAEGVYIIIKPMEERTFALHRFADFENADGGTVVSIRCRWRNTRKSYPFNRYVRLKTTVKEIRDIREASLANKV